MAVAMATFPYPDTTPPKLSHVSAPKISQETNTIYTLVKKSTPFNANILKKPSAALH